MSSDIFPPIPSDTARAARAIINDNRNFYLCTGNQANSLFSGLVLDDPFRFVQKPARTLAMLYLVTIFQFKETIPDHQAVESLRHRVDWKYALHLPLSYPGLEFSSLCNFRKWLQADPGSQQNLQTLLERLSEEISVSDRQRFNLEASSMLKHLCRLNQLGTIWVSIRSVLGVLAAQDPEWLLFISLPHWYERYGQNQAAFPAAVDICEQAAWAEAIGADGFYLLKKIAESPKPEVAVLPEIIQLRRVWEDQFEWGEWGVLWRKEACINA